MSSVLQNSVDNQILASNPERHVPDVQDGHTRDGASGRGRGPTTHSNTRGGTPSTPFSTESSTVHAQRSTWRGRGRGRGRGGGRGNGGKNRSQGRDKAPRPTHFLALPLHTHPNLRERVSAFQTALLESDPPVKGLDPTIVINPVRLHLTLGVMPLVNETSPASRSAEGIDGSPRKTPEAALEHLRSLQPAISSLLSESGGGAGVKVPLEELSVFPPGATTGANVLWLGPDMRGIDEAKPRRLGGSSNASLESGSTLSNETRAWKERLWRVSDFIHQEFKKAGYITETRPLKLHCTILNTSHRRPKRRETFSYKDVLSSSARTLIELKQPDNEGLEDATLSQPNASPEVSAGHQQPGVPSTLNAGKSSTRSQPLPVNLGVYDVNEVQLWIMGSHGPNGEYISLGGIQLE